MASLPSRSATLFGRAAKADGSETKLFATGEISTRAALMVPVLMCVAMLAIGASLSRSADIDISNLFGPYLSTGAAVTFLSLLGFIFIEFAKLAVRRADNPIPIVAHKVRGRIPLLILPALVFPIFLAGFTGSKVATAHIVGYRWDAFWADLDRLIFRDDAWRITHGMFGAWTMPAWEWVYTVGWGFVLVFAKALSAIYLPPRRVAIFYTAMMGTWLFGGWLVAYGFAAAGPVFVHLFDPALTDRFAPLQAELGATLSPDGAVRETQAYLAGAINSHGAVKGGGISAMPSMHLGAASIYVLVARGTRWIFPALAFWVTIFIGSAHFGYHYWVDGIVAAGVAWACWAAAESYYEARPSQGAVLAPQSA